MLQTTHTGRVFDWQRMSEDDIELVDIGHALSGQSIFHGHASHPLTEAQKAFYLSYMIGETYELYGLLVNAWKAYVPDIPDDHLVAPKIYNARQSVTGMIRDKFHLDDNKIWDISVLQDRKLTVMCAKTLLVSPEFIYQYHGKTDDMQGVKDIDANFHIWNIFQAKAHYMQRVFDIAGIIV